jgi:hypothetical protein
VFFDRDHRLIGKDPHQLDLPLGKRLDPPAGKRNRTDRLAFSQQWHADPRARSADCDGLG